MRAIASLAVFTMLGVGLSLGCAAEEESTGGRFDEATAAPTPPAPGGPESAPAPGAPASETPAGEPAPPAPEPGAPAPTNTCRTSRDVGAIAGDAAGSTINAQGKCGEWLRVRVTESSHSVLPGRMKLTASLVSPEGKDFDLLVYVNEDTDVVECTTAAGQSAQAVGRTDSVKVEWGEYFWGDPRNDSRTVSIQVKSKDGSCAEAPWTLLLQGNL